jgi:hypothetical protein
MAEITYFAAMAFDFIDGDLIAGEPIDCPSPAIAIQTAQGQWKVFGHAGAIASAAPAISRRVNSTTNIRSGRNAPPQSG